jgi:tetratricopeptide (TPR) repeat protein
VASLTDTSRCQKCGSTKLHWRSLRRDIPVDVLLCQACGAPQSEEAWTAPLRPLRAGHCMNCGERRLDDLCAGCGLSRAEDHQVHEELREMVDPRMTLFGAAREASNAGRRVLGLKLATAAAATAPAPDRDTARALRIWLLAAIGEPKAALEDARYWVESSPDPPAVAYASLAQQLDHQGFKAASADAYTRALEIDPSQLALRARRARLLIEVGREGTAQREIADILRNASADPAAVATAIEVGEQLCAIYERKGQESEIDALLAVAGRVLDRSAVLMAYKARQVAIAGNADEARRWLKSARTLLPEHEVYERVQALLRPARS